MKVSPSYIRSQGYQLQEYAVTHIGETSPPFSKTATILAWFGIYPRTQDERTLTAHWQEGAIKADVTASFGPRGGLSSPDEGQGLQYRLHNLASMEVQTGEIRTDGIVHTTTMPGGEPDTVRDQEALERIYRNLGSAAVALIVPSSGSEPRTGD